MKNIVSFSGGKDSTAMLLMMIEKEIPVDEIIFCDTGKEFNGIYNNINKVEKFTKMSITRIKADFSFDQYLTNQTNEKSNGWPRFSNNRWCSSRLKKSPFNKYIKNKYGKVNRYIGIASDEIKRCKTNANYHYPLADWGITEADALQYCYSKGFDFDGLYTMFNRVSCWCCPMSSLAELENLYIHFPKLWKELKEMDGRSYNSFRNDYTLDELELRFKIGNEFLQQYEIPDNPKLRKAIIRDLKEDLI